MFCKRYFLSNSMFPTILEISRNFPTNIKKDISHLITSLPYCPIWQTIEWQLMLRETGYATQSFFIGIYEQKNLLSYTLLEKRTIGLGQYGFFTIGGPVGQDAKKSNEALSRAMQELA